MTGKLQPKLLLICISFAVVLALLVMSSLPTMAASPTAIPIIPLIQNMGTVTGTLTVNGSSSLAISLSTTTTLVTSPTSGQSVTILYNKTNSDIESIILQPAVPPVPPIQSTVTPVFPPIQNGGNQSGHGIFGDFTSDMHQGVNWLRTHLGL